MSVLVEATVWIETAELYPGMSYESLLVLRDEIIAEIQKREEEPRT